MFRLSCFFVVALMCCVVTLQAAEHDDHGQVSPPTLAAVGLSNLQVMTDQEGRQVRGQALTFGWSFASYIGPPSPNSWFDPHLDWDPLFSADGSFAAAGGFSGGAYAGGFAVAGGF